MTIRVLNSNSRKFNITPNEMKDGCAYIDEKGTIFIGCVFTGSDANGDEHVVVAHSLDGQDFVGENEERLFAPIVLEVKVVEE